MACAAPAKAKDRPPPPKLPLAQWWSVALEGPVAAGPVTDGSRIYVSLRSAFLTARDAKDGHELWRQKKDVTAPMAAAGDLVFVAAGDAVEALRGATGAGAWVLPRTTPVAPIVADGEWLFVTTDTEVIAVRAASGEVVWRRPAGGVRLPPAIDGDRLYLGADDGRVLALNLKDGAIAWEQFFTGGVTAIGAHGGRVYVAAGDKQFYCLQGAKKGTRRWSFRLGAIAPARIAIDDDRVYVAALDNVVRALDRDSGNQRWQQGLRQRPTFGVYLAGHVVFVPAAANELTMLYDRDGQLSGSLELPGEAPQSLVPAITDSPDGAIIYTVTGGLTNEWNLARYAPAGEAALIPLNKLDPMPGWPYLTDPVLSTIGSVLQLLILGDPRLLPFSEVDWPIVLRDPPLVPLTVLPGLQLRPLSPVLPVRRAERGPGG